jgi:GT2 family glycosyltransferase
MRLYSCYLDRRKSSFVGSLSKNTTQVAVIIPTYNRGLRVLSVLEKIQTCEPQPAEIWVHVDRADGAVESKLNRQFPNVRVLTSPIRLGPGGGRHRCLLDCSTPYAVSFDDDSYPVDSDFFASVEQLFSELPHAAVLGASIWHRHEPEKARTKSLVQFPDYVGCGHAVRLAAYRQVRGYIPRPVAYGMEERDLSLQLFAAGWQIYEVGHLRVFHDTDLKHHQSAEVTSAAITNTGLYAFIHYPIIAWGVGLLQLANKIAYSLQMGRTGGISSGLLRIPADCYRHRQYRKPLQWRALKEYLRFVRKAACR